MTEWSAGDQAMCVKSFAGAITEIGLESRDDPIPPSIYTVTRVCAPPAPPPGTVWDDPAPCCLELEGKPHAYDCRHFAKLDPLPPEEAREGAVIERELEPC